MKFGSWQARVALSPLVAFVLITGGCSQADKKAAQVKGKRAIGKENSAQIAEVRENVDSGWWCAEHGVPEDACGQCNAKVAADCKKKGDWCKEHDRPESQCFLCHPELKEKFAALYRAKYGREPPPIEEPKKEDGAEKDEPKK